VARRTTIAIGALALALTACGRQPAAPETRLALDLDRRTITVSGISSGAYMAGQLHLARSDVVGGAALIAGGPYACAQGDMGTALGPCVSGDGIDTDSLAALARERAASGDIHELSNLADDRVWLFHGSKDTAVGLGATLAARDLYANFLNAGRVTLVDDVPAAHGMPTTFGGAPCGEMAEPYLNACDYDAAGKALSTLLGSLAAPAEPAGRLVPVEQPGHEDADMLPEALAYVPSACLSGGPCRVHIALHGCRQSTEFVDEAFARGAGYNRWAEANRIVVLYPQVASSRIAPLNPLGCWDWWGYTGERYAMHDAPQIAAIMATVDALAGSAR
jgi:hypothetical protein